MLCRVLLGSLTCAGFWISRVAQLKPSGSENGSSRATHFSCSSIGPWSFTSSPAQRGRERERERGREREGEGEREKERVREGGRERERKGEKGREGGRKREIGFNTPL